jgi:hypothetical protein
MAYRVALDGKEAIHEKKFYDIAQPIAPFRYLAYREGNNVTVSGTRKQLLIEEYYPYAYTVK